MKRHFLENLILELNCISRVAAMENAHQSQKLIKWLIDNIRYKTGREGQILKVKEELEAADNLFKMFKIRFGDAFEYNIDVDPISLDVYIPHYTLMAFVENCLYHAFENKEGLWQVKIDIHRLENNLLITIKDNGIGFECENVMHLDVHTREYGTIPSTIYRLIDYYQVEPRISSGQENVSRSTLNQNIVSISSSSGIGTSVVIKIPLWDSSASVKEGPL